MKEYLSLAEFCEYLRISKSTAHKISSSNILPKYKPFGKMVFFKWDEVHAYLAKHRTASQEEVELGVLEALCKPTSSPKHQ